MSTAFRIRVRFADGRERYLAKGKTIWDVREDRGILMSRLEVVNAALLYATSSELTEVTICRVGDVDLTDSEPLEVYASSASADSGG